MKIIVVCTLFLSLFFIVSFSVQGQEQERLTVYLSADRTGAKAAGLSIEQGIRTALSEVDFKIGGKKVELMVLDHRGSSPRAKKHLDAYLNDPTAIVLFSGLHSPPLLTYRDYINDSQILVLDPWAAAAPITRGVSEKNWIFRLSIDDSKAGEFITDYAVNQRGINRPALLLEQTGWGLSNQKNMLQALASRKLKAADVKFFNWGLSEKSATIILRELIQTGADAIFLVANSNEGVAISNAMASLDESKRLPIFSHWGIVGGDFDERVPFANRKKIELSFIQTSFSFNNKLNDFQKVVYRNSQQLYPNILNPNDIKAPTGFVHAYDLTKILISAAESVDFDLGMTHVRGKLRSSLENLSTPVQGLIKTYNKPFSTYQKDNPDAHEALGIKDYRMASFGANGEILLNKE